MRRIWNTILRLATLVTRMLLVLYIGRYMTMEDMGAYGLVSGVVIVMSVALGLRFDFIVAREIIGISPLAALCKMRDQAVFYALNHILFAIAIAVLAFTDSSGLELRLLLYVLIITIAENYACLAYPNLNSLGQPLWANTLLLVRAGLWSLPVIALGIYSPQYRTLDAILMAWTIGVICSLVLNVWIWRKMPWAELWQQPIDWKWIRVGARRSVPIWLGTMGIVGGIYLDRFVVSQYLGLTEAGVVTFYFSFVNALVTLMNSGVLAFAYPRLIMLHRDGDTTGFTAEWHKAARQVALFGLGMAVVMAIAVPVLGMFMGHPELAAGVVTFWLMLAGTWLRSNADTFHYVLFARHQDRDIWLGNILFLIPALLGNLILIPICGLIGIGYSTIASGVFLFLWRWWRVVKFKAITPSHP